MRRPYFLARWLMLLAALTFAAAQPAAAQSQLRDSEAELLFEDMSRPLIEAAGLSPRNVDIVLLADPEINAFVMQGQTVYLHSGLIIAADNVNQVQGVVAHELGHITGGHVLSRADGMRQATGITLIGLVLGGLAMAAGAGDAAMGALALSQQAALGTFLAFTRSQETTADLAGASFLAKAGISGRGFIDFFKKLQNQEFRLGIYATNSYNRTHPLSSERINNLTEILQKDPAWQRPTDPALEARFQRVRAKLIGFISEKQSVLRAYPASDTTVPARLARAFAYHRMGDRDAALAETDALLAVAPRDPFFLELRGQVLLESGKPAEAIAPLREAVALAPDRPLIQAMLGHALLSTERAEHLAEAERVLRQSIGRDNDQPFAWHQLGMIYDRKGDEPRAALATAERHSLQGEARLALASAERALRGIPAGTPDYLRAQDIAMVSRTAVERERRGGRDR